MKISDIIYREEYIFSEIEDDTEFNELVTDINSLKDGDILIIPNSLKVGRLKDFSARPTAVICDESLSLPDHIPSIRVANPRLALSNAYFRFFSPDVSKMKLIAVTGTNGKSSTAEFIKTVLTESGISVGLIGTGKIEISGQRETDPYYSMTTPDPSMLYSTLSKMEKAGCEAVVMEVSSHALALDKVAPLRFDYAVFTNLSPEHLDFHGDMTEYFKAKNKLFKNCKKSFFNIDDEYARRAYDLCKSEKTAIGIIWQGDVSAKNIENRGLDGISYTYSAEKFSFKMNLKLAGIYNVYNSMLAAAVCIDMGIAPCMVKKLLGNIDSIPGRYEIINRDISVIIDYAHTSSAFLNILRELSSIKGSKSLAVVFGCGGNRDKEKRPVMAKVAEKYADRIIVTSDNSRNEAPSEIIADIIRGFSGGCYEVIIDREEAINSAIAKAKSGDVVAIIGKGCEKYNIDNTGYHDFDEKKIVMSALQKRDGAKAK